MKIINEKGKLFGVINVVDLLVLLAAIAVIAGVGYKLFAPQIADATARQVPMSVTVRVRGATPLWRRCSATIRLARKSSAAARLPMPLSRICRSRIMCSR